MSTEQAKSVGCPWCVRGNVPITRYDPNTPDGYEVVHVVHDRIDARGGTRVTVAVCQAWKPMQG